MSEKAVAKPRPAKAETPKKGAKGKKGKPLDRIVARLYRTQEWVDQLIKRFPDAGPPSAASAELGTVVVTLKNFSKQLHLLKAAGWSPSRETAFTADDVVALKDNRQAGFLKHNAYKKVELDKLVVVAVFGDRLKVRLPSGEVFGTYPAYFFKRAAAPAAAPTA